MMVRKCEDWLRSYLQYTKASEAPDRFHYWSGVSAVAGALRRKVSLDMGLFEWTPNFFIFLVSPPGIVSKSTTAAVAMDLLKEVDGIKFGPSSATWQALVEHFAECLIEWKPSRNVMEEGLPMSCMTIVASELGTFFDPQNREQVDVLVDLYDGRKGAWEKLTKKDGLKSAINPWLNLVACTTPAWISEHLGNHFTGGGFASRSIFVYSDTKRQYVAYPFKQMGEATRTLKAELITDLRTIAKIGGPARLTPAAVEWGEAWYINHFKSPSSTISSEFFMGYLARKQTHLHKLAMVLSACQSDDLIITPAHLIEAADALNQLEAEMPKVFRTLTKEEVANIASELFLEIERRGTISRESLYEVYWKTLSYETFNKAIDGLCNGGLVTIFLDRGISYFKIAARGASLTTPAKE